MLVPYESCQITKVLAGNIVHHLVKANHRGVLDKYRLFTEHQGVLTIHIPRVYIVNDPEVQSGQLACTMMQYCVN